MKPNEKAIVTMNDEETSRVMRTRNKGIVVRVVMKKYKNVSGRGGA